MPAIIVVGAQWGDEGKGKIVDLLTSHAKHVVRAQGGNNAGHTVVIDDQEYKLHLVPSGIFTSHTKCYIGAGCVIDPKILLDELEMLDSFGIDFKKRFFISEAAHVILPYHKVIDIEMEKKRSGSKIGTTGRGIGPCYADKTNRLGIRMGEFVRPDIFKNSLKKALDFKNDELENLYASPRIEFEEIFDEYSHIAKQLAPYVKKVELDIDHAIRHNDNVLFEAAQGTFLDITLGTYPFVTSSNTTAAGILAAAGIGPTQVEHTLGIIKAYTTRVGNGPFPTEVLTEEIFSDFVAAREFGTTTGRKRRVGWFDAVLLKESIRLNGFDSLAITKLDVLDHLDEIKVCVAYEFNKKKIDYLPSVAEDILQVKPIYETVPGWKCSLRNISSFDDLPKAAKHYLKFIETHLGIPISIISLGPDRRSSIVRLDLFK